MEPKVSIIVPVYNVGPYLGRCIDSLMNQTYRNLDIILVDDGSTDGSGKLCEEFAEKDARIRVFHQKNSGVSTARNLGLEKAVGDFIGFVDSDDWVDEDMYSSLVNLAETNGADIAICGYYVNNDADPSVNLQAPPQTLSQETAIERCLDTNYYSMGASIWNKLFKKNIIQDHLLRFNGNLVIGEDMLFLCSAIMQSRTIMYAPAPKYHYAVHDAGAINMTFHAKKASVIDAHKKVEELVKDQYPRLGDLIRKRSALTSYHLLRQALGSSFTDKPVIQRLQEDVKREFKYILSHSGLSKKEKVIFPLVTTFPGLYRSFRSLYKAGK